MPDSIIESGVGLAPTPVKAAIREISVSSLPKGPSNKAPALASKAASEKPSMMAVPKGAPPMANKGPAKEAMFRRMETKAATPEVSTNPPVKQGGESAKAPESATEEGAGDENTGDESKADPEGKTTAKATDEKPGVIDDKSRKEKPNPWKMYEEQKKEVLKLREELAETNKRAIPQDKWTEAENKRTVIEKRAAELEEEIKFVNYSKSKEFKEKYEQPYFASWNRARDELKGVTIETAEGQNRPMNDMDMLELVNLPLASAKSKAVELYGDLAPEVMQFRNEIRKSSDDQQRALEDARKVGVARDKDVSERTQRERGEMNKSILETWDKANNEVLEDPKHGINFKPRDGDQQGNQLLAKGFELADRAFRENASSATTSEERAGIVRRHAAVRNRAAAYGRLVFDNTQAQAKIASLEKLVAEYKGSEPSLDGSQPPPKGEVKNTMGGMFGRLRAKAKQAI